MATLILNVGASFVVVGLLIPPTFVTSQDPAEIADRSKASTDRIPGEFGEAIRLGEQLVLRTSEHPLSKDYVGNRLNCSSCHLDGGRHPKAASFLGVASAYPSWAPREGKVITLEDRVLNCFMRSQNGRRPSNGSQVSTAITAYITWLSEGYPIRMNKEQSLGPNRIQMLDVEKLHSDPIRGKKLYLERCAECHAENGEGDSGPPVWGSHSYNDGAGMSQVPKLASWLKVAMPPSDETLTEKDAVDIATYINAQPRPRYRDN